MLTLLAGVLLALPDEASIKLEHRLPSKLVEVATRNNGVLKRTEVIADDAHHLIKVFGTPQRIAELKQIIPLFDIEPMHVKVHLTWASEKVTGAADFAMENNEPATWKDAKTETVASVTSRINDDGTITTRILLELTKKDVQSIVLRTKPGKTSTVKIPKDFGVVPQEKTITLTANIVELAAGPAKVETKKSLSSGK